MAKHYRDAHILRIFVGPT
ncbi:hypothetical protein [Bradyrhizobium centrosematis]